MDDIVERLRNTPNWQRQEFGGWKDSVSVYDRAPFEAADEITRLRAEIATLRRDAERLEFVMRQVSGAELRRIGIDLSSGGMDFYRPAIDAAIEAQKEDRNG